MPAPDARLESELAGFTADVAGALGGSLLSVVVYGSAAGDDWVRGRSDVNTALVVDHVSTRVLDALVPVMGRWRPRRWALPFVGDPAFLERARDTFPMELDDIRRQHRVLHGADPFAGLVLDREHIRLQCEYEARAKLLRLRGQYLEAAARPQHLEQLESQSLKSFLAILRHLLRLRGDETPLGYDAVLTAGERLLGPLPAMRRLLAHRTGAAPLPLRNRQLDFGGYLADVERIVAAVDAGDA